MPDTLYRKRVDQTRFARSRAASDDVKVVGHTILMATIGLPENEGATVWIGVEKGPR